MILVAFKIDLYFSSTDRGQRNVTANGELLCHSLLRQEMSRYISW